MNGKAVIKCARHRKKSQSLELEIIGYVIVWQFEKL